MPVMHADGLDIRYRIDGTGPETLVLINGVGDDLRDVVLHRLTGIARTDQTHANATLFFNLRQRDWDLGLLGAFDVAPALFPPVLPPWEIAAELPRPAAAELGLDAGIPPVIGAELRSDKAMADTPLAVLRAARHLRATRSAMNSLRLSAAWGEEQTAWTRDRNGFGWACPAAWASQSRRNARTRSAPLTGCSRSSAGTSRMSRGSPITSMNRDTFASK